MSVALKENLRDVAFTVTTPFSEDGERVQYEKLKENVRWLQEAGASVFIPCGNSGEYYSLSNTERVNVVRATVEATNASGTVIAGAGGSVKTIRELLEGYESVGADGAMIMHPCHTYIHQEGLMDYYQSIHDSTDLGLLLYKRGHEVPDQLLVELSELPNVVGVKYAVNDVNSFSRTVEMGSDAVVWSNGIAERFALAFALEGAQGLTTGIGNFVPETILDLMDAIRSENWERARQIRDVVRPYEQLRAESGPNNSLESANNVPALKYGMELAGLYGGPVREPIIELSEDDKERAREIYTRIKSTEY